MSRPFRLNIMCEREEDGRFLELVAKEIEIARAKYPGNKDRVLAVSFEYGEVMVECQRLRCNREGASHMHLGNELIQLAAVAGRLFVESDPAFRPE